MVHRDFSFISIKTFMPFVFNFVPSVLKVFAFKTKKNILRTLRLT